jgi:hypothetical protein
MQLTLPFHKIHAEYGRSRNITPLKGSLIPLSCAPLPIHYSRRSTATFQRGCKIWKLRFGRKKLHHQRLDYHNKLKRLCPDFCRLLRSSLHIPRTSWKPLIHGCNCLKRCTSAVKTANINLSLVARGPFPSQPFDFLEVATFPCFVNIYACAAAFVLVVSFDALSVLILRRWCWM